VFCELMFKFAHHSRRCRLVKSREKWRIRNEFGDLAKVFAVIRRDSHGAIRHERAMESDEEVLRYQTARRMPAFGPGIGKHNMKRVDRVSGEETLDHVGNFEPQDAGICQAVSLDFSTG